LDFSAKEANDYLEQATDFLTLIEQLNSSWISLIIFINSRII
jgi:hypothetical protein